MKLWGVYVVPCRGMIIGVSLVLFMLPAGKCKYREKSIRIEVNGWLKDL